MDSSPQNYVCRSEIVSKPFTFRWQIDRFPLRLMKIDDKYNSPKFAVGNGVPVYAQLDRKKDNANGSEMLSVFLYNASKEKRLKMDFSVTLVNKSKSGKSITQKAPETRLFEENNNGRPIGWGWDDIVLYAKITDKNGGFLEDGHRLTILVEGTVFVEKSDDIGIEHVPIFAAARDEMCEDLGKLFDEGAFSDFMVKVKDADGKEKEFKVHKGILTTRSKFFAAMLEKSELKECREGVLEVEDVDSGAMESLLRFLYTGKIPESEADKKDTGNKELELFVAADKYGIIRLKNHLEHLLAAKLSVENVCECFVVAARHSAPFLAARCREFIREKAGEVIESDGWTKFCALGDAKLMGSFLFAGDTVVEINSNNGNDKK